MTTFIPDPAFTRRNNNVGYAIIAVVVVDGIALLRVKTIIIIIVIIIARVVRLLQLWATKTIIPVEKSTSHGTKYFRLAKCVQEETARRYYTVDYF